MHYTTVLPNASSKDIKRAIHRLAAVAAQAMQDNEYRPQGVDLHVAEYDLTKRPIYVQDPQVRLFAIFNLLPGRSAPCGDRLVVIGFPYMPDCNEGCEDACPGACRRSVRLEVRVDPRFPLDPVETRWVLGKILGVDESSIIDTHPAWLLSAPPSPDGWEMQSAMPSAQCRPLSETTAKLEAAMELLPDLYNNRHLKPQFAVWYKEEHGVDPVDLDASFRHAVNGCIKRIEARRRRQN